MSNLRDYRFGTIEQRFAHAAALFGTEPPALTYEDGEVLLTDELANWCIDNHGDVEWLLFGRPEALIKKFADVKARAREVIDLRAKLEPEVQKGLAALINAVVEQKLPMESAMATFNEVVEQWRAKSAA